MGLKASIHKLRHFKVTNSVGMTDRDMTGGSCAASNAFSLLGASDAAKDSEKPNWFIDALKCGEPVIADRLLDWGD